MDRYSTQPQVGLELAEDPEMCHHEESNRKRVQNSRRPKKLRNETQLVTRVDIQGLPVSPVKVANGYSIAVGVIAREGVNITCRDSRPKAQTNMREALLTKLFDQYKFDIEGGEDAMKRVRDKSLCIMSKALNTWRTTANKMKYKDFKTVIKKKWPYILEEDWEQFVEFNSGIHFKMMSQWGKHMRTKITMNHKLGSRGYSGKRKLWENEDATALDAGKPAPFSYLRPGTAKDFVRARTRIHPVTGETIFESEVHMEVHDKLVCS